MPRPVVPSMRGLWTAAGFPIEHLSLYRMEDGDGGDGGDGGKPAGDAKGGDAKGGDKGSHAGDGKGSQDGSGGNAGDYPEGLGDAGKRALDAERDRAAKAERDLKDTQARLAKLEKDAMSDSERAVAEAKEQGKAEALEVANERLVKAEVKAAAAGKFADPSDAVALIDLKQFKVGDDGNVNQKDISKALDALLETKPHLAASAKRPRGSGDGGARQPAPAGTDMSALIRHRAGRS